MVIPGIVAASWMIMLVANGALAQGVLARFGANWRPSPDLAGLGLPARLVENDGTIHYIGRWPDPSGIAA